MRFWRHFDFLVHPNVNIKLREISHANMCSQDVNIHVDISHVREKFGNMIPNKIQHFPYITENFVR